MMIMMQQQKQHMFMIILIKLTNDDRQDARDKTITNLRRAQYDDEAVNHTQSTDITNKKVDMDNLSAQTINSRLIIPDYDSNSFRDQDAVNKKCVNGRAFATTGSLGMKGRSIKNLRTPATSDNYFYL